MRESNHKIDISFRAHLIVDDLSSMWHVLSKLGPIYDKDR